MKISITWQYIGNHCSLKIVDDFEHRGEYCMAINSVEIFSVSYCDFHNFNFQVIIFIFFLFLVTLSAHSSTPCHGLFSKRLSAMYCGIKRL